MPFVYDVLQVPSHDDGGVSLLFSSRFFFSEGGHQETHTRHNKEKKKQTNKTHTLFVPRKKNEYREKQKKTSCD